MPTRENPNGAVPTDPNQVLKEVEVQAQQMGYNKEDIRRAGWHMHDIADPYGPNPWSQDEEVVWNEYEQPALTDFAAGVYNEMVLGLGEGLSELIPTVAQAAGSEGEWAKNWIDNTSEFFENQRVLYSDAAYKPVDTFSDYFSGGRFWSTLGEGVGFIGALALTRGRAGGATGFGGKLRSFMTGTTMMYGNIYDEAIEAGFEAKDAARMGLGLAGVVSLTEGAALEWIGKGATSWMPKEFVTNTFKKTLAESAELGSKDFWKTQKLFSKNLLDGLSKKEQIKVLGETAKVKLKQGLAGGLRGGAIEFGQEFGQTYIEGIGKELYDSVVTNTDRFKDMGFKGDPKDWDLGGVEMLEEALFGGIIGGIIGGGMGAHAGIQNNVDTALGYIDKKVKKGDTKALNKMYAAVDKQLNKGKIDEEEHQNIVHKLKDLEKFATQTKNLNIDDYKANHQLYEVLREQERATQIMRETFDPADLPAVVAAAYNKNQERAQKVIDKHNDEAKFIVESKKPLTKSKQKFIDMQKGFMELYTDVFENNLTDEQFEKKLNKLGIKSKIDEESKQQKRAPGPIEEAEQVKQDDKPVSTVQKPKKPKKAEKEKVTEKAMQLKPVEELQTELDEMKARKERGSKDKGLDAQIAEWEQAIVDQGGEVVPYKKPQEVVPETTEDLKEEELRLKSEMFAASSKAKDLRDEIADVKKTNLEENLENENDPYLAELETELAKVEKEEARYEKELRENEKKKDAIQKREAEKMDVEEQARTGEEVREPSAQEETVEQKQEPEVKKEKDVNERSSVAVFEATDALKKEGSTEEDSLFEIESSLDRLQKKLDDTGEISEEDFSQTPFWKAGTNTYSALKDEIKTNPQKVIDGLRGALKIKEDALNKPVEEQPATTEEQPSVLEKTIDQEAQDLKNNSKVQLSINFDNNKTQDKINKRKSGKKRHQLIGFSAIKYDSRIADNPAMFEKIKGHFKNIFPGVKVQTVNQIIDNYGNQALGRLVDGGIEINRGQANQSTLVHEYAEAYLSMMEDLNPQLVKRGKEFVRNSNYHQEAKALYADYSEADQLREALAQALTEKTFDQLQDKFKERSMLQRFMTWAKNFWNSIKNRFNKGKAKDIVQVMSNDLALRDNPISHPVPKASSRYQLTGHKVELKSALDILVENNTNEAIMMAKFDALESGETSTANDVLTYLFNDLYDQYIGELNLRSRENYFNGKIIGVTKNDFRNKERSENINTFLNAFANKYPDRWNFISTAIGSTMSQAPKQEIDHSKSEIKPTAKISPSVRTIIGSIIDDSTGSPMSKDTVLRTILSANDKAFTTREFINNLRKRASNNDVAAQRLVNLLDNLPKEYSIPIVRDMSSLGQIKSTTPILNVTDEGKFTINKRTDNEDYRQEEIVGHLATELVKNIKNGEYLRLRTKNDGNIPSLKVLSVPETSDRWSPKNGTETEKIAGLENAIRKLFGIENFTYEDYEANTTGNIKVLFSMFSELDKIVNLDYDRGQGGYYLNPQLATVEKILKQATSYLTGISVGETGINALQNSYINPMGNRVSSYRLESNFSLVSKRLNNADYVKSLKEQPIYKNNPIVKMVGNGVKIEQIVHGAVSNRLINFVIEYADQSTIDNKLTGFARFAHALKNKQNQYEQWAGVTADRSYQTFFTAPKVMVYSQGKVRPQFKKILKDLAARDQQVMDDLQNDFSQLSAKDKKTFLDAANDMTINAIQEINGKLKVVENPDPFTKGKYHEDIGQLVSDVMKIGLGSELVSFATGKTFELNDKGELSQEDQIKVEEELTKLAQEYFWNDYVNRKSLEDLYAGPFERHLIKTKFKNGKQVKTAKDTSEAIKRYGLANAVGTRNELDKPVRLITLDLNSDSFSINGTKLMDRLIELGGALDPVGSSIKDSIFEVQHDKGGRVISGKMSTFGLMKNRDKDGNEIGNNWDEMTPPDNSTVTSTKNMAEAIIALEEWLDKQGMSDYVKIVDTDVTKNELQEGAKVISGDQFVQLIQEGKFEQVANNFPEVELNNYRTVFNLAKDLTKVKLSDQESVMTIQMVAIASNNDTPSELAEIDNQIVTMQRNQLGNTVDQLKRTDTFINNALLQANKQGANFQEELLQMMQEHNIMVDAQRKLSKMLSASKYKTQADYMNELDRRIAELEEDHPLYEVYEDIYSEMESQGTLFKKIVDDLSGFQHKLHTLDHPNIKPLMENAAASRINKGGVRLSLPGNYLRVMPDYNKDLEFHKGEKVYDDNGNLIDFKATDVSDIAIPWSMVANSREEAEALLDEMNKKGGLRVVAVRVPTGSNTMIFAAKVKYFVDGHSNNVVTPEEFIDVSDSDHDADKLFVYRQEMDDAGNVLENSSKTQMFEQLYKRFADPRFIKQTMLESVSVAELKERQQKVLGILQDVETSIRTLEGVSGIANSMKDGLKGVGIFAVAVKSLSIMHQSGIDFQQPVILNLGEELGTVTVDKIDISALEDAALYLQAALDNAKENALAFGGVTKDNMGTVAAMLISGMKVEQITTILNDPQVKKYLSDVNADQSAFSLNPRKNKKQLRQRKRRSQTAKYAEAGSKELDYMGQKKIDSLLKSAPEGATIDTDMPVGVYRRFGGPKKGMRNFFVVEEQTMFPGKKFVYGVSPEQAADQITLAEGDSDVLQSYFTLEDIGTEIAMITPIIQLDGGVPNTGFKARKIQEKVDTLRRLEDYEYFNFEPLRARARYQHLATMNKTMMDTMQLHFLTEQDAVYEVSKTLFNSLAVKEGKTLDGIHRMVAETIQTMYAQKGLSETLNTYNQGQLDSFVNEFAGKIESIKGLTDNNKPVVPEKLRSIIEGKIEKMGIDGFLSAPDTKVSGLEKRTYNAMQDEAIAAEMFNQTVNSGGVDMKLGDYLKDNAFFKSIVVKDGKVIKNKAYDGLSDKEKQERKDGFVDMMNVAPSFAKEILDYQLLMNGLNQKIGSFAELFPKEVHMNYIVTLSKKTAFAGVKTETRKAKKEEVKPESEMKLRDRLEAKKKAQQFTIEEDVVAQTGVAKAQQKAYEINAALKLIDQLPKVELNETDLDEYNSKYFNVNGELYIYENKQIDPNTNKLIASSTPQLVPASKYGSFMTDGNYYKFGDLEEYTKLHLDKQYVSKKEVDELKKCIRLGNKF
jgi:hypothetical protein